MQPETVVRLMRGWVFGATVKFIAAAESEYVLGELTYGSGQCDLVIRPRLASNLVHDCLPLITCFPKQICLECRHDDDPSDHPRCAWSISELA